MKASNSGIRIEEYKQQTMMGNQWCTACQCWHHNSRFGKDPSRYNGRSTQCRESKINVNEPSDAER